VTFEYHPIKKNVVSDGLSHLDNDEQVISQGKVLIFLSKSENSNIEFPLHTALIFKEQIKVSGLRDKGISQHYN
jgi:hypothetical protein